MHRYLFQQRFQFVFQLSFQLRFWFSFHASIQPWFQKLGYTTPDMMLVTYHSQLWPRGAKTGSK